MARRYKRFTVEKMDINSKMIFTTEIEVSNISVGGACIKTTKSLKIGGNYLIRFEDQKMKLPLKFAVVWEKLSESIKNPKGESIPVYSAGIKFLDLTSDKLVQLKDFIRISGIPEEKMESDEYSPIALRFTIQSNEKAVMNYPEAYRVKQISQGGILVEADYELQTDINYPMAIFIPGDKQPVKFNGRIASCNDTPDKEPKSFNIGIEFLNMSETDKERLNSFLGSL
jgi:c-di-GMP-binding flagellar brake protein YcgR